MISEVQLVMITNIPVELATKWATPINAAMEQGQINTCLREAAFLSQILVESGCFRYVREIWGPTPAQSRYEGRLDLGNTQPGDGHKFLGRGLIQVTGRTNYEACGQALGLDLANHPELLEQPQYAVASAVWYWTVNNINDIADTGDLQKVTKAVNGGLNGYAQRLQYYNNAKAQLFC
jgi:putative chitinase